MAQPNLLGRTTHTRLRPDAPEVDDAREFVARSLHIKVDDGRITNLVMVLVTGRQHGREGMWPDGDFCCDPAWTEATGEAIHTIAARCSIQASALVELYAEGHRRGLRLHRPPASVSDIMGRQAS
jgi:hypothetical protein